MAGRVAAVVGAALYTLGWGLTGLALYHSGVFTQADGALVMIAAPMLGLGGTVAAALHSLGAVVALAAGIGVAWRAGRLVPKPGPGSADRASSPDAVAARVPAGDGAGAPAGGGLGPLPGPPPPDRATAAVVLDRGRRVIPGAGRRGRGARPARPRDDGRPGPGENRRVPEHPPSPPDAPPEPRDAAPAVAVATASPGVEEITDPDDPRIGDYRALTDVELRTRWEPPHGLFIAEGELVLRRALRAGLPAAVLPRRRQAGPPAP